MEKQNLQHQMVPVKLDGYMLENKTEPLSIILEKS